MFTLRNYFCLLSLLLAMPIALTAAGTIEKSLLFNFGSTEAGNWNNFPDNSGLSSTDTVATFDNFIYDDGSAAVGVSMDIAYTPSMSAVLPRGPMTATHSSDWLSTGASAYAWRVNSLGKMLKFSFHDLEPGEYIVEAYIYQDVGTDYAFNGLYALAGVAGATTTTTSEFDTASFNAGSTGVSKAKIAKWNGIVLSVGEVLEFEVNGGVNENALINAFKISKLEPTVVPGVAEISVEGNAREVSSGDTAPMIEDGTDFGELEAVHEDPSVSHTFSIRNIGDTALNLTGNPRVEITGAHASDFTVTTMPTSVVNAFGSSDFTISFNPSGKGLRTATVTIANSDSDESVYTFAIQGTGVERPLRLLWMGNSFMAPGELGDDPDNYPLQMWLLAMEIAEQDGHTPPKYSHSIGAAADIVDQHYGRDSPSESFMEPTWWHDGTTDRGVIYESGVVANNNKWDYMIAATNSGSFSNLLSPFDPRQSDGIETGDDLGYGLGAVEDLPNEETMSKSFAFVFNNVRNHSPNCKFLSYESWVRAPGASGYGWYDDIPLGNDGIWAGASEAQWAARATYFKVVVEANQTHGEGAAVLNNASDGWRAKNWDPTQSGMYRWFSSSSIDKHAGSRGKLIQAMITYNNLYDEDVSDLHAKKPAWVSGLIAMMNTYPEGNESPLSVSDWDELAAIADAAAGKTKPSIVANVQSVVVGEQGTAQFKVKLSSTPASTITVNASQVYGDGDISVSAGGSLTFTTSNWNEWQSVTVSAQDDADTSDGWALVGLISNDLTATSQVLVYEHDNDGASAPEIVVEGNATAIVSGDTTPSSDEGTHYGSVDVSSGSVVLDYTIKNIGNADLTLGAVSLTGANASDFAVALAPPNTITAGGSGVLQIRFDPLSQGVRSAVVSIANNDADENPFTFSIEGTGTSGSVQSDYASWSSGLSWSGADNTATADPDADGYANVLEYVLLGNPTEAESLLALDTVEESGVDYLRLVFNRRLDISDAVIEVQHSADMVSWSIFKSYAAGGAIAADAQTEILSDDSSSQQLRVKIPLDGARKFIRLWVTTN